MIQLYYAYGVFGFTFAFISVAVQFTMVEKYHFEPAENAYAWSIISLPWVFKPVYAVVSDRPLFGYRRSYISAAAFLCGILLAYSPSIIVGKKSLVTVLTTCSFFVCVADVGCDSMMVEFAKQRESVASTCWFSRNLGVLLATGMSGVAYTHMGFAPILRITSIPVFVLALLIWDLPEKRKKHTPITKVVTAALTTVGGMWKLMLFIAVANCTPELSSIIFYKLELTLTPMDLSIVALASAITACLVSAVYQCWQGVETAVIVAMWTNVLATGVAFAIALGASPFECAAVRNVFKAVAGMLLTLPIVVHTSRKCPEGSEGTTYSIVMSWMNLTSILSETVEGAIVNAVGITQTNLDMMATFCFAATCIAFVPPVAFRLIGDVFDVSEQRLP